MSQPSQLPSQDLVYTAAAPRAPANRRQCGRRAASLGLILGLAACTQASPLPPEQEPAAAASASPAPRRAALQTDTAPAAVRSAPPASPRPSTIPGSSDDALSSGAPSATAGSRPSPAPGAATTTTRRRQDATGEWSSLTVARRYVTMRHSYRHQDPGGYSTAMVAAPFSTAGLAERSRPSAAALARLRLAQESSTAVVLSAELESEAPTSHTVNYVSVEFRQTLTYRGAAAPVTQPRVWSMRLIRPDQMQAWRVDAVLSTD